IKLRGRPAEGAILTREQVEEIGYDLVLLRAEDPVHRQRWTSLMDSVAMLLSYPDDPGPVTGEQPVGTRRRVWTASFQAQFIVRLPGRGEGGYVEISQEWGIDAWSMTDMPAATPSAA